MNERTRVWLPENNVQQPTETIISLNMPTITMEGHFRLQLVDAKTKVVKRELSFPNVITDGCLNIIGNGTSNLTSMFNYLAVGTGSVSGQYIPSGSNTGLSGEATGRTISNESVSDVGTLVNGSTPYNPYWKLVRHRVFTETQGNGSLTEIGFFNNSSGGTLANRAAIRDIAGTPTVLVKTAEDQLRVDFEWRLYVPMALTSGTFFMAGTNIEYTSSVIQMSYDYAWGTNTGMTTLLGNWGTPRLWAQSASVMLPYSGTQIFPTLAPWVAATANWLGSYTNGTYYRQFSSSFDPGIANATPGIGTFLVFAGHLNSANTANYCTIFNPTIPKTNTRRLTFAYQFGWGRSVNSE